MIVLPTISRCHEPSKWAFWRPLAHHIRSLDPKAILCLPHAQVSVSGQTYSYPGYRATCGRAVPRGTSFYGAGLADAFRAVGGGKVTALLAFYRPPDESRLHIVFWLTSTFAQLIEVCLAGVAACCIVIVCIVKASASSGEPEA